MNDTLSTAIAWNCFLLAIDVMGVERLAMIAVFRNCTYTQHAKKIWLGRYFAIYFNDCLHKLAMLVFITCYQGFPLMIHNVNQHQLVHFPLIGKGWQSGTYNFCTNWDLHTGFLSICVIFILKVWKRRWSWSKTSRNWDMPTQLMVRKVPKITPFLSTWPIMFLEYSNL